MKRALLFRDNEEPIIVSAEEVKMGLYDRHDEYVDPEYEFKVEYVKAAKCGGGPYFRLYYSYEDFKRLYPDQADRYKIVANMRRYEESEWHTRWKANVKGFCCIECTIPNKEMRRWRIADAYYAETKTCIEFQHSYISFHFEEKNEFYRALSLQAIWLYDLSDSNIKACADGSIEILENNARGFFRISENPDNLRDNFVYVQVKSGKIYRITELGRRETDSSLKSTIRFFWPSEIYEEQEFITAIRNNSFQSYEDILSDRKKAEMRRQEQEAERVKQLQEVKRKMEQDALQQQIEAERVKQLQEVKRKMEQDALQQQIEAERIAREKDEKAAREEAARQRENAVRQEMQYANYEQCEHDVLDRDGRKWIKCKFCKKAVLFGTSETSYYIPGTNKGSCYNCRFRR